MERLEKLQEALKILTGEKTILDATVEVDSRWAYQLDEDEFNWRIKEQLAEMLARPIAQKIRIDEFGFDAPTHCYGQEWGREIHRARGIILNSDQLKFVQRVLNESIREEQFRKHRTVPIIEP